MTALAGIWRHDDDPKLAADLRRMLAAQQRFGPDGSASRRIGPIVLGRALSRHLPEDVFDTGPVLGGGGRFALVADIRLDNRDALADRLGLAKPELAIRCDAAVLMHAWERWGADCLASILGDYALALWDAHDRRLYLARDPFGQRPLLLHRSMGFVAFASMASGLHVLGEVPRAVDRKRIAGFLDLSAADPSGSWYEAVERVAPGECLTIDATGQVDRKRFWQPDLSPIRYRTGDDYVAAMREQLDAAVARRLRGATRVATHLSAGLDSGGVTATAARLFGGDVLALTAVPRPGFPAVLDGRLTDEGAVAAEAAAMHPNVTHVLARAGTRTLLDDVALQTGLGERPVLNPCNAGWLNAVNDAAAAGGCGVLLTGQMGNVTFSYGGVELLPELLSHGHLADWLREARALATRPERRWLGVLAHSFRPLLPTALDARVDRLRGRRGVPLPSMRNPAIPATAAPPDPAIWRSAAKARLFGVARMDPGAVNKMMLAGWGIDQRDPTADLRLFEYCLRVPTSEYLRQGEERWLARRALSDRLPASVLNPARRGLQAADWYERLEADLGRARALVASLRELEIARTLLDLDRMDALLARWPGDGWHDRQQVLLYRSALLRGLSAGAFLLSCA